MKIANNWKDYEIIDMANGDLAVLSIEAYEQLTSRYELYDLLKDGIKDINEGNTRPLSEAMSDIRSKRKR